MLNKTLVILAAGMGSRFGGLKQMEKIDGRGHILLDYSLYDAISAGFSRALFIIRKEMKDDFVSIIRTRRWFKDVKIDFAFQELDDIPSGFAMPKNRTKPWGTAHAISCLLGKVDTPFGVINADDFYGRDAIEKIAKNLDSDCNLLVAYKLKNTLSKNGGVSRGICFVKDAYLAGIVETSGIKPEDGKITDREGRELLADTPVSMNLWGLSPEIIEESRKRFSSFLRENLVSNPTSCEYYLPSLVSELIEEKKLRVRLMETESTWQGITYKKDKSEVALALEKMVDKGLYPLNL
jgi:NDP-sugar pyrophosphorylase family protein